MDADSFKDERVVSSQTTVQLLSNGSLNTNTVINDGSGPFPLVLNITSVTVTLLSQNLNV